MGLAEQEWLTTLVCFKIDEVNYEPFVTIGQKIAKELRENEVYRYSIKTK